MSWAKAIVVLGALSLAACGGDDEGKSSTPPKKPTKQPKAGGAPAPAAAKPGAAPAVASIYTKVDDDLRHRFSELDFVPDPSGETTRDPFRSWVLRPVIAVDPAVEAVEVVDVCTQPRVRWEAREKPLRDLELIGLVKRGRSFAQFTNGPDSWIVRKGDCLGQEKAIVEEISITFIRLSVTPPAQPGAPAPPPQTQNIRLRPEDLDTSSILSRGRRN